MFKLCFLPYLVKQKEKIESDSSVMKSRWTKQMLTLKNTDSSQISYVLEVWPKGKFTYSDEGFEGEAYRMNVRGSKKQKKQFEQQMQHLNKAEERIELQKIARKKHKVSTIRRISWWPLLWSCFLVAILLATYWFFFKRR